MKPEQYQCSLCGGIFNTDWSDEEARAEKKRDFPEVPMGDCAIVCDVCYQNIMSDQVPKVR